MGLLSHLRKQSAVPRRLLRALRDAGGSSLTIASLSLPEVHRGTVGNSKAKAHVALLCLEPPARPSSR